VSTHSTTFQLRQRVYTRILLAALLLPALLLGGCANFGALRTTVVTPHPAPQALVGANVQVQASASNEDSADAYEFQSAVVDAMAQAGMVPLLNQPAPYTARYDYRIRLDLAATYGPSVWPAPMLLANGGVYFPGGFGGYGGGFGGGWFGWMPPPNWYERSLTLDIRDTATGALVWSSYAHIGGYERGLAAVAMPLAKAALHGFPKASGESRILFPR
jgi:hypothetical protein